MKRTPLRFYQKIEYFETLNSAIYIIITIDKKVFDNCYQKIIIIIATKKGNNEIIKN